MSITRTFIIVLLGFFWTLSEGSLFAQNVWETLPVFHGGRVMPLHTFAQQTVREICGSTHPYVIWDDAVIAEFKQVIEAMRRQTAIEEDESSARFRFLSRNNDLLDGGFKREYSVFEVEQELPPVQTVLPIRGLSRTRIEEIASRIRQLVPPEGRYFSADEILLSWIIEPEVWTYIPIFPVPELDYLDEMFDISFQNDARTSLYCVSLYQLENSPRYKQRCADIQRRKELGQITKNPIPFDQITERLENQVRLFRELTFHPHRQRPERMLSLLYQVAGMAQGQSSYASACDAWGYLLALGEVPGRQSTERPSSSNEPAILHPTTQRWHDVADIFHLLIRAYRQSDSRGNAVFPNPLMIEEQYETLIKLIDINLAESVALMESIYPEVSYQMDEHVRNIDVKKLLPLLESSGQSQNQVTVRRVVISYYYSVKKLRNEIEAAYLALYDNGLALRFMPMRSSLSLATNGSEDDFGVQPWASAQMILGSGETFVKRFFDPQVNAVSVMPIISGENQTIDISGDNVQTEDSEASPDEMENAGNVDTDAESKEESPSEKPSPNPSNELEERTNEELLFLPFTMESGILPMSSSSQSSGIGSVRNDLRLLLVSYSSSGGAYGASDFLVRVQQFQNAVRQTAVRIEAYRESLTEEGNEHFIKTTYPLVTGKLLAEYRYDRLNPFYWMWFFALIAVILNVGSYLAAFARSKTAVARTILIHSVKKTGKNEETELQDYTNTVEEGLFVASVFMLVLSIVVAFIGGAMRAAVTGWAPITNMYETVVMMAFSTAVLGLWYALHPILHPALQLAWIYAKFPGVSTLLEWIAAKKERQSTQLLRHETAGEIAMREAAEDFGVPEGASPGGRNPMLLLTSAEIEAQQRVRIAQRKIAGQCLTAVPRLIFSVATFYFIVLLANGEYAAQHGFLAAACNMFTATDFIDLFVVIASILLLVWFVPHILLMLIITPIVLSRPSWMAAETGIRSFEATMIVEGAEHHPTKPHQSHTAGLVHSEMSGVFHGETHSSEPKDTSGIAWLKQSRNAALNRKMFIAITAIIVFIAGLTASLNRVEFNPDIRPIAAVLRSNFWLTVHVIAIVVSYAAAFIAWGMAVFSLGCVIFGRYQRETIKGQTSVQLPKTCQMFLPVIERLLRIALLLLVIGTVLGARWADYSWGRFWSWDPKEVWALITILFYTIVFHGRVARYYGTIGITVGALFASIAVIITWYGINFVFKGSVHAYGGGAENNAAIFLGTFIAMNVLWGALALLRYSAEVYGNEAAEHIKPIEGGM